MYFLKRLIQTWLHFSETEMVLMPNYHPFFNPIPFCKITKGTFKTKNKTY